MRVGIDIVEIFPLQLFPGIDLASQQKRQDYALQTAFAWPIAAMASTRMARCFTVETEEIIFSTKWSTEADYFAVRRYGFFQQIVQTRGYLAELTRLCLAMGTPVEPVMRHLALLNYAPYPALAALLEDHYRESRAELKETREAVHREVAERVASGEDVLGNRINLVYMGKLFSSPQATAELLDIVHRYIRSVVEHPLYRRVCDAYLKEILPNRVVRFEVDPPKTVEFESMFDYDHLGEGGLRRRRRPAARSSAPIRRYDRPGRCKARCRSSIRAIGRGCRGVFEKIHSRNYLRTVAEQALDDIRPCADSVLA